MAAFSWVLSRELCVWTEEREREAPKVDLTNADGKKPRGQNKASGIRPEAGEERSPTLTSFHAVRELPYPRGGPGAVRIRLREESEGMSSAALHSLCPASRFPSSSTAGTAFEDRL